jgi:hypothetical protein
MSITPLSIKPPVASLEAYRLDAILAQAAERPDGAIEQLLGVVDDAVEQQESMQKRLAGAFAGLAGISLGSIGDALWAVPTIDLTAVRKRLIAEVGETGKDLLSVLFERALDTAFTYGSRYIEDMSGRIMSSLSVYSEFFFRSDQLIIEACAAYLAQEIAKNLRVIGDEMGSVEGVLVRLNSLAADLDSAAKVFQFPKSGTEVFAVAAGHVREARKDIMSTIDAMAEQGTMYVSLIRHARASVKAAQNALPQAPLTQADLDAWIRLMADFDDLTRAIRDFELRMGDIAKAYARVVLYAQLVRGLPSRLNAEARLLKTLSVESVLRDIYFSLERREVALLGYAGSQMDPLDVYRRATRERAALEMPYLRLLTLERLFYSSEGHGTERYNRLLELLEDPFFSGDPFEELRRSGKRFIGLASRSAGPTKRLLRSSQALVESFRSQRNVAYSLAAQVEEAMPMSESVRITTDAIKGLLSWVGIKDPMAVVSAGAVATTLLVKQASNLTASTALAKTQLKIPSVYDIASGITDYVDSRATSIIDRTPTLTSDLIQEPLSDIRPYFRSTSNAQSRSTLVTEALTTVRNEALATMSIDQVIVDSVPLFEDGKLRGLKRLRNEVHEP